MQKFFFLIALSGLLLSQSSCASWQQNKWLSSHHQNLQRLANSNLTPEQKLDGMVEDYVQFMQQDLKFIDPAKGIKFVKKYHDQNEAAMDKILRESETWQGKLNTVDKIGLGVRVAQKPYVKSLVDLAPKFKRKYKQYAFALKLATKVGGGLTRFIGKEIF